MSIKDVSFPDELRTWSGENRESRSNRERKTGAWW